MQMEDDAAVTASQMCRKKGWEYLHILLGKVFSLTLKGKLCKNVLGLWYRDFANESKSMKQVGQEWDEYAKTDCGINLLKNKKKNTELWNNLLYEPKNSDIRRQGFNSHLKSWLFECAHSEYAPMWTFV